MRTKSIGKLKLEAGCIGEDISRILRKIEKLEFSANVADITIDADVANIKVDLKAAMIKLIEDNFFSEKEFNPTEDPNAPPM